MNELETKNIGALADRILSMIPIRKGRSLPEKDGQDPLKRLSFALDVLQEGMASSLFDRAENRKFELAVENASDQIVITDPDGLILFANRAMEKISGYSSREARGKLITAKHVWLEAMPEAFFNEIWKTLKQEKKEIKRAVKNKKANGEAYISEMHIAPVLDSGQNLRYIVIIERDITEVKKLEQAKDTFLSVASHELQTPMTAIHWYLEMIKSEDFGKLNLKQKEFVQTIDQVTKQLSGLVKMLLNTSRIDVGSVAIKPEPINIQLSLEAALKEAQGSIEEKTLTVTQEYPDKMLPIPLDKNLIQVAFRNLITNAIKYNKENGSISVNTSETPSGYQVEISDTGMGIPSSQHDRIFSRMFRADNARGANIQGSGLGLYITKWIVESAGGSITFTSKENEGTTFAVTLPFTGMTATKGTKTLD
jgi:two-component system sensor histidine kinase VicK